MHPTSPETKKASVQSYKLNEQPALFFFKLKKLIAQKINTKTPIVPIFTPLLFLKFFKINCKRILFLTLQHAQQKVKVFGLPVFVSGEDEKR